MMEAINTQPLPPPIDWLAYAVENNKNAPRSNGSAFVESKTIEPVSILSRSDASEQVPVVRPIVVPSQRTSKGSQILSGDEWLDRELTLDASQIVFGTAASPVITVGTKNFIQAADKSFKTTFSLPVFLGLSKGIGIFPELPVSRQQRVLYLHGELGDYQIKDRTECAQRGHELQRPFDNFFQGRDIHMHLVKKEGQTRIREAIVQFRPELLVIDPLQQFISGCEENNFKEMSAATSFLDSLIEEFGLTLMVVAHTGKNKEAGVRGHSVFAGWRDTLFRLERIKSNKLKVEVKPRWGSADFDFHLKFSNGTMIPTVVFTGRTGQIRAVVEGKGGRCLMDELLQSLGVSSAADTKLSETDLKFKEATKKAIIRAIKDGAIRKDEEKNSVFIPNFQPDDTDTNTP